LYLKYEETVFGPGESVMCFFVFAGDSIYIFGYQTYFFGNIGVSDPSFVEWKIRLG